MDKAKRSLLIALGVGTGAALLPSKWVTPVIDAAGLPAHAQSTCGSTLTVSDSVHFCAISSADTRSFRVNDTDQACPFVEFDPPEILTQTMFISAQGGGGADVRLDAFGVKQIIRTQVCGEPLATGPESFCFIVTGTSTNDWVLTYTMELFAGTTPGAGITNIQLTPGSICS